jgi:hypothetical protein
MTVKEVIEILKTFPEELEVYYYDGWKGADYFSYVDSIELDKLILTKIPEGMVGDRVVDKNGKEAVVIY